MLKMGQRRDSGLTWMFQIIYTTGKKKEKINVFTTFPIAVAIPRVEFFGSDTNHLNITLCVN